MKLVQFAWLTKVNASCCLVAICVCVRRVWSIYKRPNLIAHFAEKSIIQLSNMEVQANEIDSINPK